MSGSALYETFARAPLAFDRGEGTWLLTAEGERYLDFAGGIAVNSLGHSHPHLVAALTEQAGKLWHVSNLYEIPGQTRLGHRGELLDHGDRVEALVGQRDVVRREHLLEGGTRPHRALVETLEELLGDPLGSAQDSEVVVGRHEPTLVLRGGLVRSRRE